MICLTKPDWQREAEELVGITADELRAYQLTSNREEAAARLYDVWYEAETEDDFLAFLNVALEGEITLEIATLADS